MHSHTAQFDQDCSWFINDDERIIGLGGVEGMFLESKKDLYDYLAKEVGDEANRIGMRFYDFRKNSYFEDVNVKDLCKFSQFVLDKKGTEKDIDNIIFELNKLKQKKHNGKKRRYK